MFLLLLVCCFVSSSDATTKPKYTIPSGFSLSLPLEASDSSASRRLILMTSSGGTFSCGFYGESGGQNAYWFSIWDSRFKTVVWVANRERPVSGGGSTTISLRGAALVLTEADGSVVWQTNATTSAGFDSAELLDTGNLVLKDKGGEVLWQSFHFPTDTLLPSQALTRGKKLVSRSPTGGYAPGYFVLFFDNDNVLKLMYDGPETSSLYWPNPDYTVFQNGRTTYNSSRIASFDELGRFSSSDNLQINASDMGLGPERRLTLDSDGNLRLYTLDSSTASWVVSWQALQEQCRVHGLCGRNGICVYSPERKCSCPPGFSQSDPKDWSKGCEPVFNPRNCSQSVQEDVTFVALAHVDYYGFDLGYYAQGVSLEYCRTKCLEDCQCQAFHYLLEGSGNCYPKSALFNGFQSPNSPGTLYLKLPARLQFETSSSSKKATVLNASDLACSKPEVVEVLPNSYNDVGGSSVRWVYLYSFVAAIGVMEILFLLLGWCFLSFKQGFHVPAVAEDGYRAILSQFRRFSYAELNKATQKFKDELGRGGFGAVYKGVLVDGRVVAVKRLEDITQGEEEFWAEVSTIGKINHMNLARMWGFCSEKRHRLLIYEYVENGSLDKHLFLTGSPLGWKERFEVALGTARGLAYLHNECLEWIIHCDVKPENILLDAEFAPKIADFGLAKLSHRGDPGSELLSRAKGTRGYMAPEWVLNLPIAAGVDVYSYGVVILEMVKGHRLSGIEGELMALVGAVKLMIQGGEPNWIELIVDSRLGGQFNRSQATKLIEVGISCVEEDRNKRPTMDWVVQGLQALVECDDETTVYSPNEL